VTAKRGNQLFICFNCRREGSWCHALGLDCQWFDGSYEGLADGIVSEDGERQIAYAVAFQGEGCQC
jgi:hypothetical protein